jgi:molybdenum cofactor cytidylyltransferase
MVERSAPVAGVLLAAGRSTRMGGNKLLFELEGESVLRGAVRRCLAAGLAPVLVVLGHDAKRAAAQLAGLICDSVVNPEPARGMTSSLRTGIVALPATVSAAVAVLPDMPFVTAAMLTAMVDRYRRGGALLVVSRYEGVVAPPTLFDRRLFQELLELPDDDAPSLVVERHLHEAAKLDWPAAALLDLDSPEDYERAKGRYGDPAGGC